MPYLVVKNMRCLVQFHPDLVHFLTFCISVNWNRIPGITKYDETIKGVTKVKSINFGVELMWPDILL